MIGGGEGERCRRCGLAPGCGLVSRCRWRCRRSFGGSGRGSLGKMRC